MADIKQYKLIGKNRKEYFSDIPGTLGGHRKLKIYGKLDCPSALRHIAKGNYESIEYFFQMKKLLSLPDIVHVVFV